jgi:hypothetical protein
MITHGDKLLLPESIDLEQNEELETVTIDNTVGTFPCMVTQIVATQPAPVADKEEVKVHDRVDVVELPIERATTINGVQTLLPPSQTGGSHTVPNESTRNIKDAKPTFPLAQVSLGHSLKQFPPIETVSDADEEQLPLCAAAIPVTKPVPIDCVVQPPEIPVTKPVPIHGVGQPQISKRAVHVTLKQQSHMAFLVLGKDACQWNMGDRLVLVCWESNHKLEWVHESQIGQFVDEVVRGKRTCRSVKDGQLALDNRVREANAISAQNMVRRKKKN